MEWLIRIVTLIGLALVGAYTLNYASWARRRGLRLGAAGLAVLAALAVGLPAVLLFTR